MTGLPPSWVSPGSRRASRGDVAVLPGWVLPLDCRSRLCGECHVSPNGIARRSTAYPSSLSLRSIFTNLWMREKQHTETLYWFVAFTVCERWILSPYRKHTVRGAPTIFTPTPHTSHPFSRPFLNAIPQVRHDALACQATLQLRDSKALSCPSPKADWTSSSRV
jgi:hypothetical protein